MIVRGCRAILQTCSGACVSVRSRADDSSLISLAAVTDSSTTQTLDLIRNIEDDLKDKLPEGEQGVVLQVVREVVERRAAIFSGPQPPPELIAEYERVAPGWGLRILEMGEREQLHRHSCDLKILAQNDRELDEGRSWLGYLGRGQIFGFIALLILGAIGVYALWLHLETAASICLGTCAVGIVGAFVKGAGRKTGPESVNPGASKEIQNK